MEIFRVVLWIFGICTVGGLILIGLSYFIGDYTPLNDESDTRMFVNPMNGPTRMLQDTDRPNSFDAQQEATPTQGPIIQPARLIELFDELDSDGSGRLERDEIQILAGRMGRHMSDSELTEAMSNMDADGSGSVDYLEFTRWMNGLGGQALFTSDNWLLKTSKRIFIAGASMSVQPVKLFISYWQIAAHMGTVLHFQFPPRLSQLFAYFKPLVVNIHGVVALECVGIRNFYRTWIVEVCVVPGILWTIVFVFYAYRRCSVIGKSEADAKLQNEMFLVLFIQYPFVTNKLFSVLNCRDLSETEHVLVDDYTVDCVSTLHPCPPTASQLRQGI
jgi:hypothetical protein